MNETMTVQKNKEEQERMTATRQLNQERFGRAYLLQNEEEVLAQHEVQKEQLLSRRVELYRIGQVKSMDLEVVRAPRRQAPAASTLSDRERKKIAKKRKNHLKKARRKHLTGATADTLPMMDQVKSFYKEMGKNAIPMDMRIILSDRMFSPDFPEEKECSIDVKQGMIMLAKLRAAQQRLNSGTDGQSDLAVIGMRTNVTLIEPLENALRTVLAANGVDMDTGGAIADARVVEQARAARAEAVAAYETAMANIKTVQAEQAELHFAQPLQEMRDRIAQNDLENRNPATEDLDFVFHYQPLEEEFVKTRESIDQHPEQYAAYKDIVDSRYQLYLDANRRIAVYGLRVLALKEQAKQYPEGNQLRNLLEERAAALTKCAELDHLQSIATQQYETIRFLMEGRPFSDSMRYMYKVLETEHGIHTEGREKEKEEMALYEQLKPEQQEVLRFLFLGQQQDTLRASVEIRGLSRRRRNVQEAYSTQLEKCGKDERVIKLLLHGAQVNETGAPLNVEEGRHMLEDGQRIRAYLSNDPKISGPLLEPIVEKVLNYPYLDVNVEEEMKNNPAEFQTILNWNVYMQNIIADHPECFSTMPEETRKRLDAVMNFGAAMSVYAVALANSRGFDFNSGIIYDEIAPVQMCRDQIGMYQARFESEKAAFRQAVGG